MHREGFVFEENTNIGGLTELIEWTVRKTGIVTDSVNPEGAMVVELLGSVDRTRQRFLFLAFFIETKHIVIPTDTHHRRNPLPPPSRYSLLDILTYATYLIVSA